MDYGKSKPTTAIHYLRIANKRKDWLDARIAVREDNGIDASYDKAERKALSWLINEARGVYGIKYPEIDPDFKGLSIDAD